VIIILIGKHNKVKWRGENYCIQTDINFRILKLRRKYQEVPPMTGFSIKFCCLGSKNINLIFFVGWLFVGLDLKTYLNIS
jgi:hypothetical protein